MFTGYAPSTSFAKQQQAFDKALTEYETLRARLEKEVPKEIKEFEKEYKRTLSLVNLAKTMFEKESWVESLGAFEAVFKQVFVVYDLTRGFYQNLYSLYTQELEQGRQRYYVKEDNSVRSTVQPSASPLIRTNIWRSKRIPELTLDSTEWTIHDIQKKTEAYKAALERLVLVRKRFEDFFREEMPQLMQTYVEEFDRSAASFKLAKVRWMFANNQIKQAKLQEEDWVTLSKSLKETPLPTLNLLKSANKLKQTFQPKTEILSLLNASQVVELPKTSLEVSLPNIKLLTKEGKESKAPDSGLEFDESWLEFSEEELQTDLDLAQEVEEVLSQESTDTEVETSFELRAEGEEEQPEQVEEETEEVEVEEEELALPEESEEESFADLEEATAEESEESFETAEASTSEADETGESSTGEEGEEEAEDIEDVEDEETEKEEE